MYGQLVEGPPPSWFDTGVQSGLHQEMGTRDQANVIRLDPVEELVWIGTQRGRLLSYLFNLDSGHVPYSRFNVSENEERVIDILPIVEGIVSLSRSSVRISSRGGVGHLLAAPNAINRMTAGGGLLSAISQQSAVQLAVGTDITKTLFYLDALTGQVKTFLDLSHNVSKLHALPATPLMVVGGSNGQLTLVDSRIARILSSNILAHPSEVSSICSYGNYVVTCGKRFAGPSLVPDVFVKVFDIRNWRQQFPLSFPSGALKAEVSSFPSSVTAAVSGAMSLLVLSNHGSWTQGDLFPSSSSLRNTELFQTECYQPNSPDIEPSGVDWSQRNDVNVLLDSAGVLHCWGRYQSGFDQPYPYRVNPIETVPPSQLLIAPRQPVMPSYPNVMHVHNTEVETRTRVYADTVRDTTWLSAWASRTTDEDEEFFFQKPAGLKPPVPLPLNVASNLRDWDMNVKFCPNVAGVGYNTLVAKARASTAAKRAEATTKSPFKQRGGISNLELDDVLLEEELGGNVPSKRWKFTPVDYSIHHSQFPFAIYNKSMRVGLENGQGSLDCLNSVIQCLFNIVPLKAALKTHICGKELCLACELGFLFHMMDEARFARNKICQPVRVSRVWKKLKLTHKVEVMISGVAKVLREEGIAVVEDLFGSNGAVKVERLDGISTKRTLENGAELQGIVFHVQGQNLPTPRTQAGGSQGHFVSIVSVQDDLDTNQHRGGGRSRSQSTAGVIVSPAISESDEEEWLLFNDFVVTGSSFEEAVEPVSWKKPVIAVYVDKEKLESLNGNAAHHTSKSPLTIDVLTRDESLSLVKPEKLKFVPLTEQELELVSRGEFTVALDTEFVSVGLADIEIREDGSREIGKPGDMVVGRVSVIRVKDDPNDPLDGVPFIDHYVAMDEGEIKDYVTRFSGIRPGDLDVKKSRHWLVSAKTIYLKLRFLVDSGCKFVGHGLHTDFRIINLWVSSSALIDTVELFHLTGQRFISLKFLASKLLNRTIQTEVHCSIEDARTALEVYRVYLKLKREGTLEQTVKSLYETGRSSGWK